MARSNKGIAIYTDVTVLTSVEPSHFRFEINFLIERGDAAVIRSYQYDASVNHSGDNIKAMLPPGLSSA